MTVLQPERKGPQPFIVADIETLLLDGVHVPYAIGLMFLRPGQSIKEGGSIILMLSEEHMGNIVDFRDRSTQILRDFIARVYTISR